MQVLKFGGTSVSDGNNILRVISIVSEASKKDKTIMVSSAIAGCTDKLIAAATYASNNNNQYAAIIEELKERHLDIIRETISPEFEAKPINDCNELFERLSQVLQGVNLLGELTTTSLDLVMSFGELLSTTIISAALRSKGINNHWVDSRNYIKTFSHNSFNVVDISQSFARIKELLAPNGIKVYVVPGFIASDSRGRCTTLGRGGSDYTASLFAAASNSRVMEIWSDVSGMMTADPRVVKEAKTITHISYKEALELSHFGAKVVYPPTIQPVIKQGIPIIIKNTFDPNGPCTIIEERPPYSRGAIRGISGSKEMALLSLEGSGMVGIPGYSARLFTSLAKAEINIILITQASSLHTMCVVIEERVAQKAGEAVDLEFAYEISLGKVNPVVVERGFSIVSLVGDDMKNQSGTGGKMFKALGDAGINIRAIAQGSSERNVSTIIGTADYNEAIKVLHNRFFEKEQKSKVAIYIAGYGGVAKELLQIIESQKERIRQERGIDLVVAGLCNSTHALYSAQGVTPSEAQMINSTGTPGDADLFAREIIEKRSGKRIFVDCTASGAVSTLYKELLEGGVSVVTCNKIAPSSSLESWLELKERAFSQSVSLLYETTAGAALPILETLSRLIESGEEIIEISAILSGTLNYLFDSYDSTVPFGVLVEQARKLGYSEPDPSIDLSGKDVVRKCTIIARECGFNIEQHNVESTPAAPLHIFDKKGDEFIELIKENEEYYSTLYQQAAESGNRLRYIATINPKGAKASIASLPPDNPLFHIKGSDNSIVIKTKNYPNAVTITGAGAGNRVTAGGVLNDIIKAAL